MSAFSLPIVPRYAEVDQQGVVSTQDWKKRPIPRVLRDALSASSAS